MGVPHAAGAPILLAHDVHDIPDAQFDISWPAKRTCGKFTLIPLNISNMITFMFQHRVHLYMIQAPALSIISL
jgi:hypothetical protein